MNDTAPPARDAPPIASPIASKVAPRVVIVGAGFAGLEAAKALGRRGITVTLIDRRNHHLFQPLLYQVATAALSSTDIAEPIRAILRRQPSVEVLLGEVVAVDTQARRVRLAHGGRPGDGEPGSEIGYDHLLVATGARTGYFGRDDWAREAPGLKTIEDAIAIRARLLMAFEEAERCEDPAERARLMTFAVIGGGPTGVEMAGAIAELSRHTLARDFRRITPQTARVLLIEGGERLLSAFSEPLSDYARARLERLGVQVTLGEMVEAVEPGALTVAGERIPVGLVIWAAGVEPAPLARALGCETDEQGRIPVDATLAVPGLPGVHAMGDAARVEGPDGEPLPGLAQVAKQQGAHLGRALARHIERGDPIAPFAYRSRGNTAIVGRNAAVYETRRFRLKGWVAWALWAVVHVYLLAGFQNRLVVSLRWLWRYLTFERGARIIPGGGAPPRPADGPSDRDA